MALSKKHEQFINEYLLCWNQTKAYQRVYDVDANVARANAARLLANASVAAALQERIDENAMSADEVLALLAEHARGDIDNCLDENGYFDLKKVRKAKKTRLIKKFKTKTTSRIVDDYPVTTTEVEFELYDAQSALALLGKSHKLFVERQESDNTVNLTVKYADAPSKVEEPVSEH